jgi:hypothetical protein
MGCHAILLLCTDEVALLATALPSNVLPFCFIGEFFLSFTMCFVRVAQNSFTMPTSLVRIAWQIIQMNNVLDVIEKNGRLGAFATKSLVLGLTTIASRIGFLRR